MKVLDAGCGYGRNLVYLLREGCEIFALDGDPEAVGHVRQLAAMLAPTLPPGNFRAGAIEQMPFPDAFADVVLCNSVLHFARDRRHFRAMLSELWRVLGPAACSSSGSARVSAWTFRRSEKTSTPSATDQSGFLSTSKCSSSSPESSHGAVLVDPLKTTIVQDYRCMTTWVLRKRRAVQK